MFRVQDDDGLIAEMYFRALVDLKLDEVLEALNAAVRSCQYLPRPAELRENITQARRHQRLLQDTRKALALPPGLQRRVEALATGKAMDPPRKPMRLIPASSPPPRQVSREKLRRRGESEDAARTRLAAQAQELGVTAADVRAAKEKAGNPPSLHETDDRG